MEQERTGEVMMFSPTEREGFTHIAKLFYRELIQPLTKDMKWEELNGEMKDFYAASIRVLYGFYKGGFEKGQESVRDKVEEAITIETTMGILREGSQA